MRLFLKVMLGATMLGGCASQQSVILPRSDGAYEIIAAGATEIGAYQRADQEAEKTCKKLKRQYRVHDRETRYQGALSLAAMNRTRSLSSANSAAMSAMKQPPASDDDYKVTILVTCV